ncbi:hypothetical protein [Agreia bicolorata]|uniref:Uncharacterized protein n=1 Tax=Agreia bicolorata TaxID=110935 RepID=A0ABR5CGC4_9MICO|nr:hypothetical protein [Agreia bicolorata]KJC64667.1 hypothetical protein TZ00_10110 [Agreia bicolorata]
MDESRDTSAGKERAEGSAFLRVGTTAAAACLIAGSIVGLGAMGALATPGSAYSDVTASGAVSTADEQPKAALPSYTEADLAAFATSAYADDALNLAVVWETTPEDARGKAGAKILAGVALPFGADEATTMSYTPDQQRTAFQYSFDTYPQLLALATAWGSGDMIEAKAEMGAVLLAHQSLPALPATVTNDQALRAFQLAGFDDSDAVKLAGLWQTDTYSAIVRAGGEILAGKDLPL